MNPSEIRYEIIVNKELPSYKETIRLLYLDAFAKAPHFVDEEKSHSFISKYDEWISKTEFMLLIARSQKTPIGFCFGWSSMPADYWYEKFLAAQPKLSSTLIDCFELVDIGVSNSARGLGIGKRLLQEITLRTSQKNLLLIVAPDNIEAKALYLNMGWKIETDRLHVTDSDYRIVMSYTKPSTRID